MNCFLIVDKPQDLTSHDVVDFIRKRFHIKKVGHAGTLDPMATGVLIVLLGSATKQFRRFADFDKEYDATLTLGVITDTADAQGKILKTQTFDNISKEKVEEVFNKFLGEIEQIPPMVSALKYKGQRLYTLARRGIEVDRKPRKIRIDFLKLTNFNLPQIKFLIRCSKGTYIRKLAEDIGNMLGCGGYISEIRRIVVGPFNIQEAVRLEDINEDHLRHL